MATRGTGISFRYTRRCSGQGAVPVRNSIIRIPEEAERVRCVSEWMVVVVVVIDRVAMPARVIHTNRPWHRLVGGTRAFRHWSMYKRATLAKPSSITTWLQPFLYSLVSLLEVGGRGRGRVDRPWFSLFHVISFLLAWT